MKKLIALCLAAMMLLCACSALAETVTVNYDDGMDITMKAPEGYTITSKVTDAGVLCSYVVKGEDDLGMLVVIAADGDYDSALRLNDLTAEEKVAFCASFIEDLDDDDWTVMTSGLGTEAYIIDMSEDAYDMAMVASLYHGYDILMYVSYYDGRTLTENDLAQAMEFFTDLTFVVKTVE